MTSAKIMTINLGTGDVHQSGIQERINAAKEIIGKILPDILFLQDLSSQKCLSQLQLNEVYVSHELPHNKNRPYTAVLWKKETMSEWKSKKNAREEKVKSEHFIVEDRFSSVYLMGPFGEKLCVVSYHGFDQKPKGHGDGCFTEGEKKKLTRDFLKCLKVKSADAIIIGGSFNLSANETPRESIFQKASPNKSSDFYMFSSKEKLKLNVKDVECISLSGTQKALKHSPVVATLEMN